MPYLGLHLKITKRCRTLYLSVGGIIGVVNPDRSTFRRVSFEGTLTGDNMIGGIASFAEAFCNECQVNATINGISGLGGIFGSTNAVGTETISNSFVSGTITGDSEVGAFVGPHNKDISNSYSVADVSGTGTNIGPLIGHTFDTPTITNSYYLNTQTCTNCDNTTGEGKTLSQLESSSKYVGWDFSDVWTTPTTGNTPKLFYFEQ